MKHIIEFDMSGENMYEEERKLKCMLSADEMSFALFDIDQYFHSQLKYNEELLEEEYTILEKARLAVVEILRERNILNVLEG